MERGGARPDELITKERNGLMQTTDQLKAFIIQLPADQVALIAKRASLAGMTIEHFISLLIGVGLTHVGR